MTARQRTALLALGVILLGAIVVPMALAWNELPDSMATHWDLGGTPNGHMPPTVLLLVIGGIFGAMWSAVWFSARRMPFEARSFITGLAGVGGLLATITWLSVDVNRGVTEWTSAGSITGVHLVVVFVVAGVTGTLGWFLAGPVGADRPEQMAAGPMLELELEPGSTPVWASRGRGMIFVVIGLVLIVIALVMWTIASVVLVVLSIPVLLFSEVRTTVANKGVVVSLGWLGIPAWTVRLETVSGADVEDVRPMAYGGWGYRVRPGTRAVVVRGGPGLRIRRYDRPDLVLTVDDAETGAALVNALVARRSS
jgi:hypothetical protein